MTNFEEDGAKRSLVRSFDTTLLSASVRGEGDKRPVLVVPAIGATFRIWHKALADVARERTIITWDLRGLHESGDPATDRLDSGAQAEDGIAVVDDLHGSEPLHVVAWSNGARIAMELAHRYPEQVASLTLVCGGYGQPLLKLIRQLEPAALMPWVASVSKFFAAPLQVAFRNFVARPELPGLVRQSGFIAATADSAVLVEVLREMAQCDLRRLLRTYEQVAGDSARDLLRELWVPTLLIAGERDSFTPRSITEEMQDSLPDSKLVVYDNATHYLPIEYPARLSNDLRAFLDARD
jgi:pimeloyl-ACP methyl ester carboxylesterase